MSESMGFKVRMAVNTSNTWDSSATALEFVSHDIKETIEIEEDEGLRGTRTRSVERVALGNIKVAGSIKFQPSPAEFEALLPFLLGAAGSSGTYALSESLPDMYLQIDEIASVYTYLLRATSGKIEGAPGKRIELTLNVVGKTLTIGAAGTFGASIPAIDTTARAYMFYDMGSGVTIAGTSYSVDKFELNVDNKIEPTYMQGQTATDLEPTDRVVKLGLQTRYTSTETGLLAAQRSGTAQSASVGFTNGSNSLTFTFGKLVGVANSVVVPGRKGLRMPLEYHVYGVSTTRELVTTA